MRPPRAGLPPGCGESPERQRPADQADSVGQAGDLLEHADADHGPSDEDVDAAHERCGHLGASLRFNPAGILLIALAVALLLGWRAERVRLPTWLLPVLLGVLWVYNIAWNPTFT